MAGSGSNKRSADVSVIGEDSDLLSIKPLGAGQEVGRSCHIIQYKNKTIMLDCGIHPGRHGVEALPYTDIIAEDQIDLLLISHFHLDHCGALPWFLERTSFKGRVFMTHATKAIYRWLLADYVKVSNISTDQMLYTEKDLEKSMTKIETIHFHQEKEVNGIKFWCYNAGHVLGAAMFMIEIAGVKILYTGDFSRQEDRHLMAAEIPSVKPDVLIIESTYGVHIHEKREIREKRFTSTVHDIVNRGGRCLIPVFALGRAQELLLILDEYWSNHTELHDIPIYYASSLAKKCMAVYQTYVSAMNDKIRNQIAISNPFIFKHISNLKGIDHFDDIGPCVVMASPGMMQSGLSRELFEKWCTDSKNGVVIAGYCVEGTLAKEVMSEPEEVLSMSGQKLARKLSVDYISFSAHTDYEQTSEFIRMLMPPHIILVHGEQNEMMRLKTALVREYQENPEISITVHTPRNCEEVQLYFRGEKMAKVMGSLAVEKFQDEQQLSGVLIKRGFSYHIVDPSDLSAYTNLKTSTVMQRQILPFSLPFNVLHTALTQLTPNVKQFAIQNKSALKVFDSVVIAEEDNAVVVEWTASNGDDMYADAVVTVILQIDSSSAALETVKSLADSGNKFEQEDSLIKFLHDMYGEDHVVRSTSGNLVTVKIDGKIASIDIKGQKINCDNESLKNQLTSILKRHSMCSI